MDYDIAVIGGGPAGVSAAITAASKGRKVVLFEAHGFSPRLRSVAQITDYMGYPGYFRYCAYGYFCKSSQADGSRYH